MMESLPVEMLSMIMEHFSNAELLKISLVSKLFNYEARSLLITRANLNADLGKLACQNVLPFVSHLKEMDVIPFSGIKIRWHSQDHTKLCSQPHKNLNPSNLDILDRVAWKRLSVSMRGGCYVPKKCPAMQLVQKLLEHFSAVLEELELNIHLKLLRFIQEIIQDRTFPKLKILKLEGPNLRYDRQEIKKSFIKEVVARAPNLQEFHENGPPDLSENVLEGSSSAVLVSHFEFFNPALHEFSERFTGTVKLKAIKLYYTAKNAVAFSMERFKGNVPMILKSSCETLRSIDINLDFLVALMGCRDLCLKNVTDFRFEMDYAQWADILPRIFSVLKQFDFARVFPKLTKVVVCPDRHYEWIPADHMTEFLNAAIVEEPSPDRAMNIKHLSIFECLPATAVSFLAEMFPCVEKVAMRIHRGGKQVPYSYIWKHWLDLKELEVENFSPYTKRTSKRHENLDTDFCGIFPAEVALLREQDDEYLRAVHIVPVMPSIACLRAVRTLRIVRRHDNASSILEDGEADPIFSRVTALIVFQRYPNLSVNIQTSLQAVLKAMNHLKPYAAVELV